MEKVAIIILTIIIILMAGKEYYEEFTKDYTEEKMCIQEYCPDLYDPEKNETCPNPECYAWIKIYIKKGFNPEEQK